MNVRLFPIVLFAATSLLTLKAFDMVFSGDALFTGAAQARAEEKKPEEKKSEEKKADEKPADATKSAEAAKDAKQPSLLDDTSNQRPQEKISVPKGEESAESALNDRLGEKRRALEDRTKELDLRENLLKAAESKLEERMKEIKQLEAKLNDQAKAKDEQAGVQIKGLVQMFETMKPGPAAAIFDKLEMKLLIEVVSRMKPAVTAQVMAKMTPESAQKLTAELTRRSLQPAEAAPFAASSPQAPANAKELPRIDNPPAKQN